MMKRSEGFFEGYQDTKLFFQVWEPHGESKGLLVITHGHGEHSDSYHRLVRALEDLNLTILGWDLRGHGKSDGQRGYAANFSDYTRDFEVLVNKVVPSRKQKHIFYFAHSFGALIQLKSLAGIPEGPKATQILSSPFLQASLEVPAYKEIAAQIFRNFIPQVTLGTGIRNGDLSRDPIILEEYDQDSLRHDKMSSGAYLGAQEAQKIVLASPDVWKGRMLFLLAENDPVVKTSTTLHFVETLKTEKTCWVFEDRKHELINDLGRDEIFDKIRQFLLV